MHEKIRNKKKRENNNNNNTVPKSVYVYLEHSCDERETKKPRIKNQ